ncbi:hypothetical protein CPB85DRAFT_1326849 [Mucidula mucida]|nr:hypothetical protein CPB85DRAFT_1326849 [Mucidula mucida]
MTTALNKLPPSVERFKVGQKVIMAKATLASDGTEIPAGTPGKITEVQDRRVTDVRTAPTNQAETMSDDFSYEYSATIHIKKDEWYPLQSFRDPASPIEDNKLRLDVQGRKLNRRLRKDVVCYLAQDIDYPLYSKTLGLKEGQVRLKKGCKVRIISDGPVSSADREAKSGNRYHWVPYKGLIEKDIEKVGRSSLDRSFFHKAK